MLHILSNAKKNKYDEKKYEKHKKETEIELLKV